MKMILDKVYQGKILTQEESFCLFQAIINDQLNSTQLSAVLIAMKIRGEQTQEIVGAASSLLQKVKNFSRPDYVFADIVGTGGDGTNCINISTASAFVAATCGVKVAKHSNRSISSKCGSADLLESLGINVNMTAEQSLSALENLNICFLFAPYYHVSFLNVLKVRKQLNTSTIFNILGPLINPARPPLSIIGVYSSKLVLIMAHILKKLNYQRAIVVHSGGMDKITLHSPIQVAELNNGRITVYQLTQKNFRLPFYKKQSIIGGTPLENRNMLIKLFQGQGTPAYEHTIAANVAMLLKLFGQEDLCDNVQYAIKVIRSGKVYERVLDLAKIGS